MKVMKKAIALLLCVVMTIGIFSAANISFEDLAKIFSIKAEAYTNTTIGRITQQQVVGTEGSIDGIAARDFWYGVHANGYFGGHSEPTNMVIPGLGDGDDYTPQGMTYWEEKNWVLISAYDASSQGRATCIYAIDVASGKFVALFNIYNADGTVNTSHGGGIAASEHNFYFADSGSNISYFPLSEMNVAEGTEKNITLKGTISFAGEMNSANTSYCCYDDGVLWVGNFYYSGDSKYTAVANAAHKSMLLGYKLEGNSSAEEWNYLNGKYKNLVNVAVASGTDTNSGANLTWNAFKNGDSVDITGSITAPTAYIGEFCPSFGSFNLTEGVNYVVEFVSTNNQSDLYLFAPNGGGHTNVKQSNQTTITQLDDGRYHYRMTFTAGLKPTNADSSWPTTQSTNGTYTGAYTMRFDQDAIQAGEARDFVMTDIAIREANTYSGNEYGYDRIHFAGTAGNPTYVVAFPDTIVTDIKYSDDKDIGTTVDFDKIQYAMVDNGRIYVSRSWSREIESANYLSEIDIIDIDLNVPGTNALTINGATRNDCYVVTDASIHQFHNLSMGEAVCVIDDYLYMFTESAAYNYRKKNWDANNKADSPSFSSQPVDVVWKIDQYAIMGEDRKASVGGKVVGSASAGYVETYEKINSIDELNYNDKYMIVYESETKAANGNKILYALDSYGGYKDGLVPKNSAGTQVNTGDSLGIIGHPITKYSSEDNVIKLNDVVADDKDSLHWSIIGAGTGAFRLQNHDSYYGKYKNLYFGSRLMYMMNSEGTTTKLDHMKIQDNGDGTFSFYYDGNADYYLWCNDGTIPEYTDAYNDIYNNIYAFGGDSPDTAEVEASTGVKAYAGQVEQPGTFHSDAFRAHDAANSGNKTGAAVNERFTKFHLYRRAEDTSLAGESGLSTDLNAELQADGTYTITLESYSTGQTITKKSTNGKPIDFVFVLDTSASMTGDDAKDVPYWGMSDNPEPYDYDLCETKRYLKYGDSYKQFDRALGEGSQLSSSWGTSTHEGFSISSIGGQYITINGNLKSLSGSAADMAKNYGVYGTFTKTIGIGNVSNVSNKDTGFSGGFYWTNRQGDATRFEAMKSSTLDFIEQIKAHAAKTGLQHRIAIIQYGSTSTIDPNQEIYTDEGYYNTGMYSTVNGISMVNYGDLANNFSYIYEYSKLTENGTKEAGLSVNGYGYNMNNATYENAFFPANHDNLVQIVNNLSITKDSDTFVDHGMTMAMNTIADQMTLFNTKGEKVGDRIYGTYSKSGTDYGITEDQINSKAVVINITDGAPGYSGSDTDAAFRSARPAIDMANSMKAFDVEIYNVQIGTGTTSGFDNAAFLNALSSNYINGSAKSKYETTENALNLGTANGSGYYIQHNLANQLELDGLFDTISQAGEDSILEVETVTLNSSSVTLQSLGDTFMLTNDSKATAKTSQIYYDSLGRIYEEDPVAANYTISTNVANNTVQLTGFDYSTEYVASGNDGKKLYLQIEGVLLNPDKEHGLNLPISNDTKTAIYADSTALSSGTATQYFPQVYFEVPTYSYIYDYGVSMANTSIYGTPISFDTLPDKQSTPVTNLNIGGDAAISYNGTNVVSNVAPSCSSVKESYTLLQKPNGSYYWAKVKMIPASNIYFEETSMSAVASNNKDWSTAGSPASLIQSISSASDVYGYDTAYATNRTYSNGSAKQVTVDSSNKRSDTQTFTFTGTGFDLISACGTNTGVQTVTVKQGSTVKKVFIVDTFYNDSYGTLTQVPVVHYEGDYGTYTVESTAVYLSSAGAIKNATVSTQAVDGTELEAQSAPVDEPTAAELLAQVGMEELANADVELVWMDDDSIFNGGAGAQGEVLATQAGETTSVSLVNYIDGFRIYNPLPAASQSSYISNESNVNYYNIINSLASSSDIVSGNGATSFIGYVEKILGGSINFSDYAKSNAPKNEVYLTDQNSSALTFKVKLDNSSSRVMLGMRAVSGTPTIVINGSTITANGSAISSATEMYYDITEAIQGKIADGYTTITVQNTAANSILAVNNVKVVNGSVAALASEDILEVASLMTMAVTRTIDVNSTKPVDYSVLYPGQEPSNNNSNPDPDLDVMGRYVITTPEMLEEQQKTQSIIEKLVELFKSIFEKIFSVLKSVFSMISFIR